MSAKRREIYARAAVQLRTHDRAREAEKKCNGAMGLYLYLLLQARGEETAGDVSESAAHESWSAPTAYRRKQAAALIAVGLVTRIGDRLVVTKYEEHNDTPDDIANARRGARDRMRSLRTPTPPPCSGRVLRTEGERSPDVPCSLSLSNSGSGSPSRDPDLPSSSPREVPAWFGAAISTVEDSTGELLRPADSWLRYSGHRANKGVPISQQDAVYWLTTVMVPEARKERRGESDKREREARWSAERAPVVKAAPYHQPFVPAEPDAEPMSQEASREALRRLTGAIGR